MRPFLAGPAPTPHNLLACCASRASKASVALAGLYTLRISTCQRSRLHRQASGAGVGGKGNNSDSSSDTDRDEHGCSSTSDSDDARDPRLKDVGHDIHDDYAHLREHYATPKNPIVLAHGLLGFSVLNAVPLLPPIHYWHGITSALHALLKPTTPIITPAVPPSGTIAQRAAALAGAIAAATPPDRPVNIIAHSMGGLDARCMISSLLPQHQTPRVRVASLTTIATPHRGSAFADYMLDHLGLEGWYGLIGRVGLGTGAFRQLTRAYMADTFNPAHPDAPDTRYFSFGAATPPPGLFSPFRGTWHVVNAAEGPNDGLVSVESSRWGEYRGTLQDVSHLDLINWTNRAKWEVRRVWTGKQRSFNAVALYLDIADMLAKEGL